LERDSSKTWQGDVDAGANTLTIATGHVVDTLRYVAGDLERVASGVTTQVRQWVTSDTGERVTVTSPDNVIIAGSLRSGAALSVHVAHVPWHGNGYRMEIYGDRGTLIATGQNSPQLTAVSLRGAQGVEAMRQIAIPTQTLMGGESGMPAGEGFNVAQLYREFAVDIRTGAGSQPTFDTAVDLHRIIDVIKLSSDTGSAISLSAGG
jgi:predicted dehydrogenase